LRPADTEKFLKEIKTIDQNYVVKVMPGQTEDKFKVEIEEITADSHVILLERKNKIDQMASMYVAQTTGVWLEMDGDQQDTQEFSLDIDKDEVSKVCDEIAHNHQLLKTKQYHQKLFYEDIELKDTGFRKQLKPTNYEDIKKEIYFYAFENLPELLEN
jgi:LPS sulfotransferase NodH